MPQRLFLFSKKVWGIGIVAAAVIILAIFLPKFGFGPGGGGGGSGGSGSGKGTPNTLVPTTTPAATRPGTTGPLRVAVRGEAYFVDNKPVPLPEIMERAKLVRVEKGPAVVLDFSPDSIDTAEEKIKTELRRLQIEFAAPEL